MNKKELAKIDDILEMIVQLALGNFAYRYQVENPESEIENIGERLNYLAEELGMFISHPGVFGIKNMADPYVFAVNEEFKITGVNCRFVDLMQIPEKKLLELPLSEVVTESTYAAITQQLKVHFEEERTHTPVRLLISFHLKSGNILDCWGYCHFVKGADGVYFLFRGLPIAEKEIKVPLLQPKTKSRNKEHSIIQYQADIMNLRKVHQYILSNLHQKLPSLNEIARKFNLNEFKLKKGFKALYQTPVVKFHREKRLEMAYQMIVNTPTPLSVIAKNFGFMDYPYFSKAFKKKYGKSPSKFKDDNYIN
ncbi:helix-turn-helix domain-containing protein [Zunongwangia mangrovi]|uniref:helix-turn-helix domain-containing protein n=1 Tax=Zunongwangia mangrovi TaxID=1334022 RepID=UPI0015870C84|nr:AraC family transcriptional regulator [Zunongwangia mangrovi]